MAGVAGDIAVAFEIVFVDGEHHLHHFASGDFRLLVVFVEIETFIAADVAILTFDAERSGDELHGGEYQVGGNTFQSLDIFELFFGEFGMDGSLRWIGLRSCGGDG